MRMWRGGKPTTQKNERQYAWKQEWRKGAARAAAKMWGRSLPMNQSPQETLRRMRRGK
jgi:hypothetical protein